MEKLPAEVGKISDGIGKLVAAGIEIVSEIKRNLEKRVKSVTGGLRKFLSETIAELEDMEDLLEQILTPVLKLVKEAGILIEKYSMGIRGAKEDLLRFLKDAKRIYLRLKLEILESLGREIYRRIVQYAEEIRERIREREEVSEVEVLLEELDNIDRVLEERKKEKEVIKENERNSRIWE